MIFNESQARNMTDKELVKFSNLKETEIIKELLARLKPRLVSGRSFDL